MRASWWWVVTIGATTEGHLDRGTLLRWGQSFVRSGEPQWARAPLERFFEMTQLDSGPHSLSRVVLRRRIGEHAVFGSPEERAGAKAVLSLMRERGALDYLFTLAAMNRRAASARSERS